MSSEAFNLADLLRIKDNRPKGLGLSLFELFKDNRPKTLGSLSRESVFMKKQEVGWVQDWYNLRRNSFNRKTTQADIAKKIKDYCESALESDDHTVFLNQLTNLLNSNYQRAER